MQEIYKTTLDNTFFNNIAIDASWNFDDKMENKMHRIHAYPAKFPAFITRKAIIDIEKEQNRSISTVGDVFCGCSTTAYEAMLNDKDFWGCDINPVAVLIAKTKSNIYKEDKLSMYFEKIEQDYEQQKSKITDQDIDNINPRIHYWFSRGQIRDLQALKIAIELNVKKSKPHPN